MIGRIFLVSILWLAWVAGAEAKAQGFMAPKNGEAMICPITEGLETLPDFSSPQCKVTSLYDIDPQGSAFWIKVLFQVDDPKSQLGLYLSGKLSSDIFLNGTRVGSNGVPGQSAETEVPGKMAARLG